MKELFFIDYSEDEVLPKSADSDLVLRHETLMKNSNMAISVYKTKDEMMSDALEWASQAKDGSAPYEHLSRESMEELMSEWRAYA